MRIAALFVAVFPIMCHATGGGANDLLQQLHEAQEKWRNHGPEDYTFTISNSCFCLDPPAVGPLRLTIKNGKIRRATYIGDRSSADV